jgi:hypothetical protein
MQHTITPLLITFTDAEAFLIGTVKFTNVDAQVKPWSHLKNPVKVVDAWCRLTTVVCIISTQHSSGSWEVAILQ